MINLATRKSPDFDDVTCAFYNTFKKVDPNSLQAISKDPKKKEPFYTHSMKPPLSFFFFFPSPVSPPPFCLAGPGAPSPPAPLLLRVVTQGYPEFATATCCSIWKSSCPFYSELQGSSAHSPDEVHHTA